MREKCFREQVFTKDRIVGQLREMGVKPGDGMVVHTSYKSIGAVEGGPDAVVDALLEAVGPRGHLMFPAFTFVLDYGLYDPATTPTNMGVINETARKRKEFYRSNFPNHSVIVAGPQAVQIAGDHISRGHLRPGDPFDRLAMMGGYVLLLGVSFRNNTTGHIGECYADLPHRRQSMEGPYETLYDKDGECGVYNLSGLPACFEGFTAVEGIMRERSHIVDGHMGSAPTKLMKGKDLIFDVVDLARRAPWALYCNDPSCGSCVKYRAIATNEYNERKRREGEGWSITARK